MLTRWLRARRGDINEDPEIKPRRNEASAFFLTGLVLVVLALIIMAVVGGIMRNREAQAPVEGKTNVSATQ